MYSVYALNSLLFYLLNAQAPVPYITSAQTSAFFRSGNHGCLWFGKPSYSSNTGIFGPSSNECSQYVVVYFEPNRTEHGTLGMDTCVVSEQLRRPS